MAQSAPDINQIGKSFVEHYYNLFDNNRAQLANLFQGQSMLSFENEGFQGQQKIMEKLCNGVKFKTIQHQPKTLDCQPSGQGGLLVMVTGQLKVDNEKNPLLFSEVFHLLPTDKTLKQFW
eukprot:CAMPEP_0197020164 /NCGR_PEP_ID=MMETSP1384-20130603/886_1 /TAXON_ID=29189 /ORGANISM="Ammonia sp." /LENGTH=119 /DNA_ID=CAMNT_0042447733 /DNA_START=61 /DNA_END=417 /DNA_ORIENTATION=+